MTLDQLEKQVKETEAMTRRVKADLLRRQNAGELIAVAELEKLAKLEGRLANLGMFLEARRLTKSTA